MGLYSTTTTLQTRMIATTFDSATTALASQMITDAEAEVNKYLSRRYDLSAAEFQTSGSVPPIVTMMTNRLAEGYMWISMSRGSKESISRGEALIEHVMSNLEKIANYEVDLVNTAGGIVVDMSNTSYRIMSNTKGYSNTFNEDDPLLWTPDSTKLTDIESERG